MTLTLQTGYRCKLNKFVGFCEGSVVAPPWKKFCFTYTSRTVGTEVLLHPVTYIFVLLLYVYLATSQLSSYIASTAPMALHVTILKI